MKRHALAIIILFAIVAGVGYAVLNTTWVMTVFIRNFAQDNLKDFKLSSFQFHRQRFVWPDTLYLYGVQMSIEHKEETYNLDIREVQLPDMKKLWKEKHQLKIFARGADVSSRFSVVRDVDSKTLMSIHKGRIVSLDGIFEGQRISFAQYNLGFFTARLKSDSRQLELFEVDADGYGGTIKGQAQVSLETGFPYIIWLEFSDFQTNQLDDVYKGLFADVDASLNGNLRAIGNTEAIELFDVNFNTVKGGTLKKPMLEKVLNHMLDPRKKDIIRSIIVNETSLFIDEGALHIRNANKNVATITFSFENSTRELYVMENVGHTVGDGFPRLLMQFYKEE